MAVGTERHDIVPTHLAIKAMRDNGYKNAAYALAELMDNSIQAGATRVELLCADERKVIEHRERQRLREVAVLDNGCGMDEDLLQIALQFGNGSRLESEAQDGMGKFGMGLPSASISQAKRVDVWSWQEGVENALHSHIDLEEVEAGELRELPLPQHKAIPEFWLEAGTEFGASGTLVVWSKIDRCLWRTSNALVSNSEALIGRMYRQWIHDGSAEIRMATFNSSDPSSATAERLARPNDPLYLMDGTSCPEPFDQKAMFRPFPSPEAYEVRQKIRFQGKDHEVKITFSIATEEARGVGQKADQGSQPHGKHAARNLGVSVVRAGRELELDQSWINSYDPRERWWGVEVAFEPGLDELMGVSNNKQWARNFAEAAKLDTDALAREHGGSIGKAREALIDDEDPLAPLLDVAHRVRTNIGEMRKIISAQRRGHRADRHDTESVEAKATEAVRRRQQEGHTGASDAEEAKPKDERQEELKDHFVDQGQEEGAANDLAATTIDHGLKYQMSATELEGGTFFSVQSRGGVLVVSLNTGHPAYGLLVGAQAPDELPDDVAKLRDRLQAAQEGLEMMLFAWARYEDEQAAEMRKNAQRIRFDWGRMAENFLEAQADG